MDSFFDLLYHLANFFSHLDNHDRRERSSDFPPFGKGKGYYLPCGDNPSMDNDATVWTTVQHAVHGQLYTEATEMVINASHEISVL